MSDSQPAPAHRAVFVSYAREDTAAAQRIAEALRSHGVEVWFDQNELRGGDAWDQKIRKQINDCALFLPIISRHTQERAKGYFRLEWKLAVEQTHLLAEGVPYLAPIVIDDTTESGAIVPPEFLRVQWTRLPGALATPQFVVQVQRLLHSPSAPPPKSEARVAAAQTPSAAPSTKSGFPAWAGIALGVAVLALVGYIALRPGAKEAPAVTTPIKPVAETKAAPTPAAPKVSDKSIAVLPFTNMSEEKDSAFFADGVHEDILTNLALVPELKVVSRTTVTQYRDSKKSMKQIGEELGVAYILEGSVRRMGNKVRVTGQLINARTDEHVWAKSYDRDLTDIFAIQASLSQEIASALQAAITPQAQKFLERRPTENPVAYDAFLKGRETTNNMPSGRRGQLVKAEGFFQTAVDQDPKFAAAWGQLAEIHARFSFWNLDVTPERRARGEAAIANAARLAPDDPAVLRSIGAFAYYADRDYAKATAQYEKIARLQPNDPTVFYSLGLIQRRQGHWAESLVNLRKATELDPGNTAYLRGLVQSLRDARRWDQAIAAQRRLSAMLPGSSRDRQYVGEFVFYATGSRTEFDAWAARETASDLNSPRSLRIRKLVAATSDYAEFKRLDAQQPFYDDDNSGDHAQQALGWAIVYAANGDLPAARARLADFPANLRARLQSEPVNPTAHLELAFAEALLGHRDEAVRLTGKAIELLPESRDALDGVRNLELAAEVFAWTGDKDRAIALLTHVLQVPSSFSVHFLREDMWLAPLRGDPRFEALLTDPANNAPLF